MAAWVGLGALILTLCGVLVQVGRLTERQKVHSETLESHDEQLGELRAGQSELGELRAELRGLRDVVAGLRSDLAALVKHHMEAR